MPFDIKLMTNNSEKERVDKDLTQLAIVQGELRMGTSLLDPVFMIDAELQYMIECNYVVVPSFGRSYFVTEPASYRNGLYELTCHADVLSSWKTQLLKNRAIIDRQETKYNLYLNDGSIKSYANPFVKTIAFPSGFSTPEFVLAVAGASNAVGP